MNNINFKEFGKENIMVFAKTYFPHYLKTSPCNFHRDLCGVLQKMTKERGGKLAVAAPRGHAKSTFVSLIYVLWSICYSKEKYIFLLSDTNSQAEALLSHVKNELENNELLNRDFPEVCLTDDDKKMPLWKKGEIVTKNNIKITALGAGQKIRGRRNQEHRPTLIILDDIENDENTQNPETMDKLNEWFERAVMKAGTNDTNVILVGTIQGYGCLLAKYTKEKKSGWEGRTYKAVISFAKREDLWAKWKVLYDGNDYYGEKTGLEAAAEFFKDNEKDIMEGVEVLWPEKENYYSLMVMIQDEGENSFNSEKQNEPIDPKNAVFKWDGFQYWDDIYKTDDELKSHFGEKLVYFAACDPSLGKPGPRGDYSAIIVIAKNVDGSKIYVVEADIAKRNPEDLVKTLVNKGKYYRFRTVWIESNQFQELLVRDINDKAYKEGVVLNVAKITNHTDKFGRIETLATWINAGNIMFAHNQRMLIDQLKHFPKGAHDDGPDALAMVVTSAQSDNRTTWFSGNSDHGGVDMLPPGTEDPDKREYGDNYKIDDGEDEEDDE